MQDSIYREIILEHYKNPQNYGVLDHAEIDVSEVNSLCGDELRLTIQIKNNCITDIAFESLGCAISKASASLFTEEVKGKTLKEIQNVTQRKVLDLLEVELTPARTKCALLVHKAFLKGVSNYDSLLTS